MKKIIWTLIGLAFLVVFLAMATECQAIRQADSITLVTEDVTLNTSVQMRADVTWIGSGVWDGQVNFTWYNISGVGVFYQVVTPDGTGVAYSSYTPNDMGTWYINGTWTTDSSVYDNESFIVTDVVLETINNVTWSDGVDINITFFKGYTWIGEYQSISITIFNSTDFSAIAGVSTLISVTTTDGESVVSTTDIGDTSMTGTVNYVFKIPVDTSLEDRFMDVSVSVVDVDYTGSFGWLAYKNFNFYCGYYIAFSNDSVHPVNHGYYDVNDYVICEMNYTMNYSKVLDGVVHYHFINSTSDLFLSNGSVHVVFDPSNILDSMAFKIPQLDYGGSTYIVGYIRLSLLDGQEFKIFRKSESFIVNATQIFAYNNLPFPVSPVSVVSGDIFNVTINRTTFDDIDYFMEYYYLNIDTGTRYGYYRISDFSVVNISEYKRDFVVPDVPSGSYKVYGISKIDFNGWHDYVSFETVAFNITNINAVASSDLDVFYNYTRIQCDGTGSSGYNDSYWGLRWTSSHAPNKTYYGLEPVIIIDETGNYTITLNVTNGHGHYSEDWFMVYSLVPPLDIETDLNYQNTTSVTYEGSVRSTILYDFDVVVKDSETGETLDRATVTIDGEDYQLYSGDRGVLDVRLYGGYYLITVNAVGYEETIRGVTLVDDETISVGLVPEAEIADGVFEAPEGSTVVNNWILGILGVALIICFLVAIFK